MANKIIIVVFVLCVFSWQAHAAVNCTDGGRFADPDDTTCKNYSLCVKQTTGAFIAYNYTCPTTSVFNPRTSLCTAPANYVCNVTVTNNTTPASSPCTADGFAPDPNATNCSSYLQCVQINGTFIATPITCPNGTFYNPNSTLCEATYNCTATFTCTSVGRFPDSSDTTCQAYYYCVQLADGSFEQYSYTCPSTSVFSPTAKVCTTTYTCPT